MLLLFVRSSRRLEAVIRSRGRADVAPPVPSPPSAPLIVTIPHTLLNPPIVAVVILPIHSMSPDILQQIRVSAAVLAVVAMVTGVMVVILSKFFAFQRLPPLIFSAMLHAIHFC